MASLLQIKNLSVHKEKPILQSVSFELSANGLLLILGPSGSGKSTLLRCLNRLEPMDSGTIRLDAVDISKLNVCSLRRRVGMVFQTPSLLPGSVEYNLLKGPTLEGKPVPGGEVECLATAVGIKQDLMTRQAETLSVGEQQRVAFAQTLANHPDVLLLDEPTSALDPTSVLTLEKLILKIHQEMKRAIIMVTHNIQQALRLNAETLVIIDGKVMAQGAIQDLVKDQTNETLLRFFKGKLGDAGENHEL